MSEKPTEAVQETEKKEDTCLKRDATKAENVTEEEPELKKTKVEEPKKEEEQVKTPAKFVFGQNSKFGGKPFSTLASKANIFASKPSKIANSTESSSSNSTTPKPFVFGNGSKFSNAFQKATSKKSIFDDLKKSDSVLSTPTKKSENDDNKEEKKSNEEKVESSKEEEEKEEKEKEEDTTNLYQAVKLEKTEIKSGEEEETSIFTCKAKLYFLNLQDIKTGWKERGLGMLHVNLNNSTQKARVVMRTFTILKLILNSSIGASGFELFKGMPSSLNTEKFIRINSLDGSESEKPTLVQYAIKVSNADVAQELYEVIDQCVKESEGSKHEDNKEGKEKMEGETEDKPEEKKE